MRRGKTTLFDPAYHGKRLFFAGPPPCSSTSCWPGRFMAGPAGGGVLAVFLLAFCPNTPTHAYLINTDFSFAATFALAVYAFYLLVLAPFSGRLATAGGAMGLALGSKLSGLVLLPGQGALLYLGTLLEAGLVSWGLRVLGGTLFTHPALPIGGPGRRRGVFDGGVFEQGLVVLLPGGPADQDPGAPAGPGGCGWVCASEDSEGVGVNLSPTSAAFGSFCCRGQGYRPALPAAGLSFRVPAGRQGSRRGLEGLGGGAPGFCWACVYGTGWAPCATTQTI